MGQLLETAPRLSRSALHRCLQRHGISRQPAMQVSRRHGKFEETTLGFVHIDSAEMKISSGRQHMFVAIDRVTKFTHVAFFDRATKANAAQFLRQVLVAFPYRIHTVLTDSGRWRVPAIDPLQSFAYYRPRSGLQRDGMDTAHFFPLSSVQTAVQHHI